MNLNVKSSEESVEVWLSIPGTNTMLVRQPDTHFAADNSDDRYTIAVNEGIQYQQIDGFGGSLTDASCWLLKYVTHRPKGLKSCRIYLDHQE
ncbi:hypothetical protein AB0758_45820 [Tolypothrix bouteillei VB521301_2]|uniref:hypothetical protein n=1 Tax=Tolypothrix bouteillei TaxID=1246981 RepID=UPI0038B63EA0